MKIKDNYFFTLREDSKDEETKAANLLIRSGMIKKVGSGTYMYLPMGLRVINNIENIIREEMTKLNIQELSISNTNLIEEVASLNLKSYKDLPFSLYSISTNTNKVEDDRYSIIDSKEYIGLNIYTFIKNEDELTGIYEKIYEAYNSICKRIGLNYKVVLGLK